MALRRDSRVQCLTEEFLESHGIFSARSIGPQPRCSDLTFKHRFATIGHAISICTFRLDYQLQKHKSRAFNIQVWVSFFVFSYWNMYIDVLYFGLRDMEPFALYPGPGRRLSKYYCKKLYNSGTSRYWVIWKLCY